MEKSKIYPKCPACGSEAYNFMNYPSSGRPNELGMSTVAECKICDLAFAVPMPTDLELSRFYSEGLYWQNNVIPTKASQLHAKSQANMRANWCNSLIRAAPVSAMDIGAGYGWQGDALKKIFYKTLKSYSFLEPDEVAAEAVTKRLGRNFSIRVSELEPCPKYDIVFLNQVLEHVTNPLVLLSQIKLSLNPGGFLYIETPNRDDKYKKDVFPHTLFYNRASMEFQLRRAGYHIVAIESFGAPPGPGAISFLVRVMFRLAALLGFSFIAEAADNHMWNYKRNQHGLWLRTLVRNHS